MGMIGISRSEVSRLCEEIDVRVKAFLGRPIDRRLAVRLD
jgi:putative transposase